MPSPRSRFGNVGAPVFKLLRTQDCAFFVFPLGCLSAAERSDRSRDRAGLEDRTTDAAVRPAESECQSQPCIEKRGLWRRPTLWETLTMPVTEQNDLGSGADSADVSAARKQAPRGPRYWAPRILTAVLIPAVLIGAIEGALRLSDVGFPTDATVPCTLKGQPASCYNLFFPA